MDDNSSVTVLYASETGTAEDVAYKLHGTIYDANLRARIVSTEDYEISDLPSELCVIFIVSTTGDGEVPSAMKSFWTFLLRRSLPNDSLKNMSVAVFGLGDSSYEKFNAAARRLNTRLQQLGAKELLPIGLGDDQARYGYCTALDKWIPNLLERIKLSSFGSQLLSSYNREGREDKLVSRYNVVHYNSNAAASTGTTDATGVKERASANDSVFRASNTCNSITSLKNLYAPPPDSKATFMDRPLIASVKENARMTSVDWFQDVRHIVLDVSPLALQEDSILLHKAGDIASVYPVASRELVDRMLTAMRLSKDTVISAKLREGVTKRSSRIVDIGPCTLEVLFSRVLDISGMPQRSFFEGLAKYTTTNVEERDKLFEISSAEGTDLYYDYCIREKRNYVEVLEDFKSARPPIESLLELIPLVRPRHYSIASSGLANPNEMDLCVAVTSTKTRLGRIRSGLCSNYLASLSEGDQVVFWIRKGTFKAPPIEVPLIMVGPGTGVAPMRAFLQERRLLCLSSSLIAKEAELIQIASSQSSSLSASTTATVTNDSTSAAAAATTSTTTASTTNVATRGNTILFFGCRKRSCDFLYGSEWYPNISCNNSDDRDDYDVDVYSESSTNTTVVTAFSRDQENKVYVTHKLRMHTALVWQALEQGARVFIAGSAKSMPKDVRAGLTDVARSGGGLSAEEAASYVVKLERSGRYTVEAWSA